MLICHAFWYQFLVSGVRNLDPSFWYEILIPVTWTENLGSCVMGLSCKGHPWAGRVTPGLAGSPLWSNGEDCYRA